MSSIKALIADNNRMYAALKRIAAFRALHAETAERHMRRIAAEAIGGAGTPPSSATKSQGEKV